MIICEDFDEFVSSFKKVMPFLSQILGKDLGVHISNTNNFINYIEADSFKLGVKPGDEIPEKSPTRQVIKNGKAIIADVPKEVYGTAFRAIINPIFNKNNTVVGCIGISVNLSIETKILEVSKEIEECVAIINGNVAEITSNSGKITKNEENANRSMLNIQKSTNEIYKVTGFVKEIANQTKMLGLNASIEAARAGEHGVGFGVVSKEIQKLSHNSSQTAEQISKLISETSDALTQAINASKSNKDFSEGQLLATEKIAESVNMLKEASKRLIELSKSL